MLKVLRAIRIEMELVVLLPFLPSSTQQILHQTYRAKMQYPERVKSHGHEQNIKT
jgi:hypothetical protein